MLAPSSPPPDSARTPPATAMMAARPSAVLGVRADALGWDAALARIAAWVEVRHTSSVEPDTAPPVTRQIVTLNPEMVMAARADPALRASIAAADLVVPDGVGVVWALRRAGWPGAQRIPGVDLLAALAQQAAARGWRLYLLGAAPGVAAEAAHRLCARFPGLRIAGTHPGMPDATLDEAQCARIRASRADLVAVAFGAPAQERWIARNRTRLGAAVAIGVGGALDLLAGRVPRAPRWLRRAGLEWAFRLARQPWRWRRMLALPRFALAVLLNRSS